DLHGPASVEATLQILTLSRFHLSSPKEQNGFAAVSSKLGEEASSRLCDPREVHLERGQMMCMAAAITGFWVTCSSKQRPARCASSSGPAPDRGSERCRWADRRPRPPPMFSQSMPVSWSMKWPGLSLAFELKLGSAGSVGTLRRVTDRNFQPCWSMQLR